MRDLRNICKAYFPPLCAMVAIAVFAAVTAPQAAADMQNAEDGASVVTASCKAGGAQGPQIKTKALVLGGKTEEPEDEEVYDKSVLTALGKMNLSADHIGTWIEEHPKSALKSVKDMPAEKQRTVANVATFIKSINAKLSPKTVWREAAAIVHYCEKYNISTELAVGIAKAESHFRPNAQSKAGAVGVMQVMWKVHYGMLQAKGIAATKEQMFDPERGIEAGILILSRYVKAYGSVQKALNRYYGGISTAYLRKVNNNMALLESHTQKSGL